MMRLRPWMAPCVLLYTLLGLVALTTFWRMVFAQGPATPSCEQQVSEAYLSLTKDQLLALVPDLPWPQQLTAIASSPREMQTRWEMKRNQVDLAEKNVAQLLEHLRRAQAEIATLKAQLAATPPPSN